MVATALLRFALMFQGNAVSSLVLNIGYEPVFDYLALAVLAALGGWLIARPDRSRPALAVIAGLTPWAILPIVGDLGLVMRWYDCPGVGQLGRRRLDRRRAAVDGRGRLR